MILDEDFCLYTSYVKGCPPFQSYLRNRRKKDRINQLTTLRRVFRSENQTVKHFIRKRSLLGHELISQPSAPLNPEMKSQNRK